MKEIKKSATIKSKVKNKEIPFNVDLNYSEEYDSFNIKVKKDVGFMSYTDSLQGLPLEVVQKLNEMLEEVLIKAGSETEIKEDLEVEIGAEPNPSHSSRSHEGSVKIKTYRVKVKSLSEAQNEVRGFIEENDLGSGNFNGGDLFSHGKKIGRVSYNGRVWNLKDEPMKMHNGGDFQSGVYAGGGEMDLTDDKILRLRKPVIPIKRLSKKEWAEKYNPRAYEFMGKDKMATGGGVGLVGNQSRIDMNKNGKIDAEDFKLLRSSMNGAWRNERKHVNQSDPKQDYEVRYARKKPARTGYKGKRNFATGGGISNFERLSRVVANNYQGKRVKPQYQKEYGKVYSKLEAKEVGDKVAGKMKMMKKSMN
jgi:hypothetical protein